MRLIGLSLRTIRGQKKRRRLLTSVFLITLSAPPPPLPPPPPTPSHPLPPPPAPRERGAVHISNRPLLDPDDCKWLIRQVEAQCKASLSHTPQMSQPHTPQISPDVSPPLFLKQANGGWSTQRHVQAPTTDIPISQVPAVREWFDHQVCCIRLLDPFPPICRTPFFPCITFEFLSASSSIRSSRCSSQGTHMPSAARRSSG